MIPNCTKPNYVKHYKYWILKSFHNVRIARGWTILALKTHNLGKHHIIPEVEQVEQQAQKNNNSQYQHVL